MLAVYIFLLFAFVSCMLGLVFLNNNIVQDVLKVMYVTMMVAAVVVFVVTRLLPY